MTASLHLHRNRNRISLRTLMSERVQQHDCDVITQYRDEIYARMPDAAQGALNAFIRNLFGDDGLVRAYLHPVATPAGEPATMPLDLCERAANQASRYPRLLHCHERELAVGAT